MEDKDTNLNGVAKDTQENNNVISKPKAKKGNSWQKEMQMKRQSRAFKLIDRRFQQKEELLDGMIMLREPLQGEIYVDIDFDLELLQKTLEEAMHRWSLNVGFHELRSLKSSIGLQASTPDIDTITITSKYVAYAIMELVKFAVANTNMAFELMRMGKGEITAPTFVIDLMHLSNGYTQLHEPTFLEKAQLQFFINECDFPKTKDVNWNEGEKVEEFFGSLPTANFVKPYNFINRLNKVSNLMGETTLNINDIYNTAHPSLLTCLIDKKKQDGVIRMKYGQNTVKKDILLNSILQTKLYATTLQDYHIDDFTYTYYSKGQISSFKRILLEEYFNIPDTFVTPTITTSQRQVYNGNVVPGEPIDNG